MVYKMNIAGLERELPLCTSDGSFYIAGFVLFGDVELTERCAEALLERAPEFDYIICPEAKAISLAYELSRISGKKFFVARKGKKLYMRDIHKVEVRSITTAFTQTLYLDGNDADEMRGKRVLLLDDVISTGESIRALEELVLSAGGLVAARAAVLAEGDAAKRGDILFLAPLPLFGPDGQPK